MKKLICMLLVVVMTLNVFVLTVSAYSADDGWTTTYDIAKDDKGNLLTAHNQYGKTWSTTIYGIGQNDASTSPGAGQGIIIFEGEANYVEATFTKGSGTVSNPLTSGILFCLADRTGNWTFWNGNYNYYWLAFDAENILHIYRCYDCDALTKAPDLVKEADRIDLDDKINLSGFPRVIRLRLLQSGITRVTSRHTLTANSFIP